MRRTPARKHKTVSRSKAPDFKAAVKQSAGISPFASSSIRRPSRNRLANPGTDGAVQQ